MLNDFKKEKMKTEFAMVADLENEETTNNGKPISYSFDELDKIPEFEEAEIEIDEEADAFSSVAPPDAGTYQWQTGLGETGIQVKQSRQGSSYYSVSLEFTLVSDNPNLAGASFRRTFTTIISRGKGTSTLATLLNKNGIQVKGLVKGKQQLAALEKFIKSESLTWISVEWEAQFQDERGKYIRVKTKQKEFSKDKEGKWIYRFEKKLGNGSVIEYGARLYPVTFLGAKPEAAKASTAATASVTGNLATFGIGERSAADLEKEI